MALPLGQLSKSELLPLLLPLLALLPLLLPTLLLLKPLLRALSTSEANFWSPGPDSDPGLTYMAREARRRTGGLDAGVQLWSPGPTLGPRGQIPIWD